jgi:hypothetical protein
MRRCGFPARSPRWGHRDQSRLAIFDSLPWLYLSRFQGSESGCWPAHPALRGGLRALRGGAAVPFTKLENFRPSRLNELRTFLSANPKSVCYSVIEKALLVRREAARFDITCRRPLSYTGQGL